MDPSILVGFPTLGAHLQQLPALLRERLINSLRDDLEAAAHSDKFLDLNDILESLPDNDDDDDADNHDDYDDYDDYDEYDEYDDFYSSKKKGLDKKATSLHQVQYHTGRCFIMDLPDEILANILEIVHGQMWRPGRSALSAAYACRRFYFNIKPILYSCIRLTSNLRQNRLFHRTLRRNPSVGLRLQRFEIQSSVCDERYYDVFAQITPYLVNVTWCGIGNVFDPFDYKNDMNNNAAANLNLLHHSLPHMPNLQHLELRGDQEAQIHLGHLLAVLQLSSSLTKLDVDYISEPGPYAPAWDNLSFGSSNITELSISFWHESAQAMAKVLDWIRKLKKFILSFLQECQHYLDLPMLHRMLLKHKDTLVQLSIDHLLLGSRGAIFDLTHFTALQELCLDRRQLDQELKHPDEDANKLVAPNLKLFELRFGGRQTDWTSLGEKEERWLRTIARVAANRPVPDCEIKIMYYPGRPKKKSEGYPWDRITRLNEEVNAQGVVINSQATMTKIQWLEWSESFEGDVDQRPRSLINDTPFW